MNKKTFIIIAIIVVVVVGFWWWSARQTEPETGVNDINLDLEALDINNLDAEFQQIDQDLKSL